MRLSQMLAVPTGITAVVGGGGKTSLIWWLGQELSQNARVLITATAKMWPPACETLVSPSGEDICTAFEHTGLLAIGTATPEGKLTQAGISFDLLCTLADYVLVEADGSRGLPLKAPNAYEPVLPQHAALTIAVAGMSCAGQTILQAAHRPYLYAELAGLCEHNEVTPAAVARVLIHPQGQHKNVDGRFAVVLNQADTPQRLEFAYQVAQDLPATTCITALRTNPNLLEQWHFGKRVAQNDACKTHE